MPIKKVKQHSDRGNLADIQHGISQISEPATPFELRLVKLYECNSNSSIFITTDYISDKNALPLSIYRIRKIVEDIKSEADNNINKLSENMSNCLSDCELSELTQIYLRKNRVKTASLRKPAFWKAN